jgi:hypothetical protein
MIHRYIGYALTHQLKELSLGLHSAAEEQQSRHP